MIIHHEGTKDTKVTKAPGLLESVYEMALCRELWMRGINVERQVAVPVHYKGGILGCDIRLDVVGERNVILEVKSVEKLTPVHKAQLLTYLRLRDLWLGLLLRAFVVKNHWTRSPLIEL